MKLGDLFNEVQAQLKLTVDAKQLPTDEQLIEAATIIAERHNMRRVDTFVKVCECEFPTSHIIF